MKKIINIVLSVMLVVTMIPATVLAADQGGSSVEQRTVFSDNPLLNANGQPDGPLDDAPVSTGIEVELSADENAPPVVKRSRYVYVGTYTDGSLTALSPVTDGLRVQYLLSETGSGPEFDQETKGITVTRYTNEADFAAGNDCRYSFEIDTTAYEGFSEGQRFYDVRPANIQNVGNAGIRIQLGGGNQGGDNSGGSGPEGEGPGGEGPSGPPENLFWAYASEGTDPEEAVWSSSTLDLTAGGSPLNVYLAFRNGEELELVNVDVSMFQQGSNTSFQMTKNDNNIYTFTPGSALTSDWIQFSLPGGPTFEMGVRVGDGSGLKVMYKGELIGSGAVIQIPEGAGSGYSMDIYYNGVKNNYTWGMGDSSSRDVSSAGVSPDNQMFEVYLSGNAVAGDKCRVTLYYGDDRDPITATFNVEVTPGIRLTYDSGNTTVMPNGTISGLQAVTVQIMFDGKPLTSGYNVGTSGNCIVDVNDNADGTLTLKTIGNGYGNFTVWYSEVESTFTWHGAGVADGADGSRNVIMEIDGVQKQNGESYVLQGSSTLAGKICFNGVPFTSGAYAIRTEGGNAQKCSAVVNSDGTFTLTTYDIKGYTSLVFEYTEAGGQEYSAVFEALISAPEAYILQFKNMEQLEDESWRETGMATLGIFKKNKQANYVKYVVTDELMRPVSTDHFVDVDPEEILVIYYDPSCGQYVPVPDDMVPFTFEMVPGQEDIMKITYYRGKDKLGPEYKLVYTNLAEDPYLDSDQHYIEDAILLWTSSVSDFVNKEKLQEGNNRWHYNAKVRTQSGIEENDDCTVERVSVDLQEDLFGTGGQQIQISSGTVMDIETDLGTVTLDDKVLTQIDNTNKNVTLDILNVDKNDEEYKEFKNALQNAACVLDLNLNHEGGKISDFGNGKVTIALSYELQDSDKKPYVYYVDAEGNKHLVECTYDADRKELSFDTNHFSLFEVEEAADNSGGGGSGGSGSQGGSTSGGEGGSGGSYVPVTPPAADPAPPAKSEEEERSELIAEVENTRFSARSQLTTLNGKKAIKVTWDVPEGMEFDGFAVYRSTKRDSGYGKKPFWTTTKTSYINNKDLKVGQTYYYKVRAFKYINDEKIYTEYSYKAWRTVK